MPDPAPSCSKPTICPDSRNETFGFGMSVRGRDASSPQDSPLLPFPPPASNDLPPGAVALLILSAVDGSSWPSRAQLSVERNPSP